jgi:nitrogen regulatory protein P-II 2
MNVTLTKVTIITENLLKDRVLDLIRSHGVTGFTLTQVEGEGSRGVLASDWEGRNIKVETIVDAQKGDAILDALADSFFENYSVVCWLSDVRVKRGSKFTGPSGG